MPLLDIPQGRGAAEPSNYQLRSNEGHLQGEDSASAMHVRSSVDHQGNGLPGGQHRGATQVLQDEQAGEVCLA